MRRAYPYVHQRRTIGGAPGAAAISIAAAPAASVTPATIMGANCIEWWRGDLGITIGTGVSAWHGQVGGVDFAQATGGSQPTYNATGAPNNQASLAFDGTDDSLAATLARAAPGTKPAVIWMIFRQDSWTLNEQILADGAGAAVFKVVQNSTTPALRISDGAAPVAGNTAAVIGSWFRGQFYFENTVNDGILIGGAAETHPAASSGNNSGTQPLLGRDSASAIFANLTLSEIAFFDSKPSAGQKTSLDSYVTDRYGAGLT